jgi:hypothetical protein
MLVPERGDPTTKIGLFILSCISVYGRSDACVNPMKLRVALFPVLSTCIFLRVVKLFTPDGGEASMSEDILGTKLFFGASLIMRASFKVLPPPHKALN